ncbi:hypothetical protein E2C01_086873 [Portunus trituberculatus]|uniref:Uncharacterized protein n=1 Tax=Portunus trituberculatus TaxID=210409 RepID=A0A5B7JBQ8_PORTR|nr:hypothetical protein [Portunus trituberculatus]
MADACRGVEGLDGRVVGGRSGREGVGGVAGGGAAQALLLGHCSVCRRDVHTDGGRRLARAGRCSPSGVAQVRAPRRPGLGDVAPPPTALSLTRGTVGGGR